jgi:hypothetical protein
MWSWVNSTNFRTHKDSFSTWTYTGPDMCIFHNVTDLFHKHNSTEQNPLGELTLTQPVKKLPASYRIRRLITVLQEPIIGPYSESDESSPHLPILLT